MKRLIAGLALLLASASANAVTYYVRTDGGSSTQCTGRSDAAYPGSGSGQACAYNSLITGMGALAQSDTLIIANGSYQVSSALPVPPSGTTSAYTRILGENHGNCRSTPEVWGSNGRARVIDVSGRSNIEIACLEVTDRHACMESHPVHDCTTSQGARAGIYAYGSNNIVLRDIHSHGMAYGLRAGKVNNLTLERVRLNWNSRSGFEGATGGDTVDDSFSGTILMRNVEMAWNGCGQNYPSIAVLDCFGDNRGGYGDGIGTKYTGGNWIIEDSSFHHNTSDGLDLRYTRAPSATVTIRRSSFFANAGNQVKAWGRLTMENSYANSWCGYFGTRYATNDPEACRANGNTVIVIPDTYSGVGTILRYNTIAGHGAALIQMAGDPDAGSLTGYSALIEGNVVVGAPYYLNTGTPSKFVSNSSGIPYTLRNNHVYNAGSVSCSSSQCVTTNPLLRNQSITAFDPRPQATSPILGAGNCTGCVPPDTDITGRPRPAAPARGAFEYVP